MSEAASKTDELVAALMAAAKKNPPAEGEQTEAADYDFHTPHRFTRAQLTALQGFAAGAAESLSKALGAKLGGATALEAAESVQHYAGRFSLPEDKGPNYCARLETDARGSCGVLVVPAGLARQWVARILGGEAGDSGEQQPLSTLESSLLEEMVAEVTATMSQELKQAGAGGIRTAGQVTTRVDFSSDDPSGDYCVLAFAEGGEGEHQGFSFVLSGELAARVVDSGGRAAPTRSAEEIRKDMLSHVGRASIAGWVQLGSVRLAMRDVAALEPGDVLIMSRNVNEPVELLVQGRTVLTGYPAQCEGSYALQVVARAEPGGEDEPGK